MKLVPAIRSFTVILKKLLWGVLMAAVLGTFLVTIGWSQEIQVKVKEGIPVIYNPKNPIPPAGVPHKLTLIEDLIIRGSGFGRQGEFKTISAIRADDSGNIYALEARAAAIHIFDRTGKHLKSFGKLGQGPGDLEMPNDLHVLSNETLIVTSKKRISWFSLRGEFREIINNCLIDPRPKPDSQGNFVGIDQIKANKNVDVLSKYDSNLWPIFTIAQLEQEPSTSRAKIKRFPAIFIFAVMANDEIIWGINDRYVLTIVNSEGEILRKIVKDYDPVKYGMDDKEKFHKKMQIAISRENEYDFPDYYPAFGDIHADDENRIFVGIYEVERKGYRQFDVFDSAGRYIARIALSAIPIFWKKRMLYCVEEDIKGFQLIKRYRVTWE
jgi:hypothetical protein